MSSTPERTLSAQSEGHWLELLSVGWREPGDLDATLTRIAEVARETFAADLCVVFAINPVTQRFVERPGVAGELPSDNEGDPLKPPRKHGLTQRVIEEGFLAVQDVAGFADDQKGFCLKQGVTAFAAVALRTVRHGKPLAVLYVDYREPQEFSEDLEEKLRRFAGLASRELQVTWFLRRYQWIGQIGQRLNRRLLSEDELFAELSAGVGHVIDTSGCVVWGLRRPESRTVDLFVGKTVRPGVAVDSPLLRLLEGRGGSPGPPDEESAQLLATLGCEAEGAIWVPADTLFEPLGPADAPLGFVSILHREADAFDEEDRHLLRLLASQVALALANRRLFDHLRRLHAAGRTLSRNLQSETVLQTIVDTIRDFTRCDLAVLFPCDPASEGAFLPARWSGQEGDESPAREPDSVLAAAARSVLDREEPLLLDDARELFTAAGDGAGAGFPSVAGLPLWIGEEAVGALILCYRTPQRFLGDPAHTQLIEGLGEYAAIAIENARRFGAEQTRYERTLEAVRELDRKLIRSNDLDELLTTILEIAERRLAERVAPDEASILLYDPVRDELVTRAAIGPNSEKSLKQVLRRDEGRGITLEVLRTGESILIPDTQEAEYRERFVDVGGETRCELDVPLKDGQELVGILNLESRTPNAFDERDRGLMETLAGQAVLAVKMAQAFEDEQRLRKDEETLIELGKELTRRLDADGLLDLILQQAITNTGAQAGVLVRVDPNQRDLVVSAEQGVPEAELGRHLTSEEGILGWVARKGQVVNADLTRPDWQAIHVPAVPGMNSELAVPMKLGDEVIGIINVESPNEFAFGPRNERLLEGLADLAVIALQNAEAYERAERRRSRFQLLHEAGQRLARTTSLDDLGTAYSVVVVIAAKQFDSEVVVRRFDTACKELVRVANARTEGPQVFERIPLADPLNGQVARERKTLVVHDAENPPPEIGPFPRSNDDRSFVVTPILFEEMYYGNLSLSHPKANHFRDLDVQL
ncbi:MAG TPA: GAF domain-containing protein, partial [Thermoanaerobaculia bacterium]|nr:GAF domain-containing protein [Thermoanaerobaculia bacterium]